MKINIPCTYKDEMKPEYATEGAAGADLKADIVSDIVIPPGKRALVPTGVFLSIPPGYEGQVRPRSGLAFKYGIMLVNAPGTIDSDYRGEIKVVLYNSGDTDFTVRRGERIAQLVISPVMKVEFIFTGDLDASRRGQGGFGSTGR